MKFYIECEPRKPSYKKRMRKILVKQVDNILQSKDCLVKLNVCVSFSQMEIRDKKLAVHYGREKRSW